MGPSFASHLTRRDSENNGLEEENRPQRRRRLFRIAGKVMATAFMDAIGPFFIEKEKQ